MLMCITTFCDCAGYFTNRRRACRELELTASAHLFSKLTAASNDRTDTL